MALTAEQNASLEAMKKQLQGASASLSTMKAPAPTSNVNANAAYQSTLNPNAFSGSNPSPIAVDSLTAPQSALKVPNVAAPTTSLSTVDAYINSLMSAGPSQEEQGLSLLREEIMSSLKGIGQQSSRKAQLEAEAGLADQKKQLTGIANQLQGLQKEYQAIPLQIQQEYAGRGATAEGVAPIEADRLRANTIKQLGLAAAGQTIQGNIALANESIQSALDAEFSPQETRLKTLQQLYMFNKDALERSDKKRADALNFAISERSRLLEMEKVEKNGIYEIGKLAAQYGADPNTVQKIFSADSREAAMMAAGKYMRDPAAALQLQKLKYEVEKARLDVAAAGKAGTSMLYYTGNTTTDLASLLSNPNVKVGATTKSQLANIIGVQGSLEQMAKDNPKGVFKGIDPLNYVLDSKLPLVGNVLNVFGLRESVMSKEAATSRAYIQGINLKVQQWASGASLSAEQTRQVTEMTPKVTDTDKQVKNKVNALYEFMNQQTKAQLLSEGIDYPMPQDVDLWRDTQTLEGIFGK